MKEIKTYEEMNKQICGLLKLSGDNVSLYAAQRIQELEAENNKLRARLENAVELPVKLKDTVWFIDKTYREDKYKIRVGEVSMLQCLSNGKWKMRISTVISEAWGKSVFDDYCDKIGIDYFTDRTKAEAKIKEQGGNN